MSKGQTASFWAKQYKQLAPRDRQIVNEQTNALFRQRTHVMRKLDPRRDRALCRQWIQFRDEIMEKRSRSGRNERGFLGLPSAKEISNTVSRGVDLVGDVVDSIIQSGDAPWMEVALEELRRGVAARKGKEAHPRIMMYSQTCPHLYATKNKTKYMNRKGDEGFKWCSAFVNWCVAQTGIVGTRNALAMSWLKWGEPIPKPQYGAIVILKTSSWNHVAFVDDTGSELKMLGGNQKPEYGKGPQCVSYQKIIPSQVVGYRLPTVR